MRKCSRRIKIDSIGERTVRQHWTMAAVAPAAPALNLQRPLVASTDSQHAAGQFSVRRNGEVQHIRVLQEAERQDVNIRKIRWVFSEGADTYQIELRHGRVSGVRKLFINRAPVDAVRYSMNSEARSSMTFYLDDREGQPVHKACVRAPPHEPMHAGHAPGENAMGHAISLYKAHARAPSCTPKHRSARVMRPTASCGPHRWWPPGGDQQGAWVRLHLPAAHRRLPHTAHVQGGRRSGDPARPDAELASRLALSACGEAPAAQSPLGSARKAVQRSLSFGKRDSAAKRATAEMVACCHLVALDKAQGPVGITLANSETQLADSKRKVGVVVHAVEPLGSAAAAGLMVGDVIMAVNGKTVSNHWEAIAAVDHDSHVEFKVRPARAPPLPRATCVLHVAPPTGELLCPYAAPAAAPRT